jgi:3',5'-cyclic AMP phosphodiesterase CpdA
MHHPLTLIHVSDLHFVNEQSLCKGLVENGRFFTKRHLGWVNYKFRRQKYFNKELKPALLRKLLEIDWDYLIITGDITTLALESEFELARESLEPLIKKGNVLFTTGNHDRYVKTNPEPNLLRKYFSDCWPFTVNSSIEQQSHFYELGKYAVLLELNMATPQRFYSSRGRLCKDLSAVKRELTDNYNDHLKLAIGHYPAYLPTDEHEGFFHSLAGREKLKRFLLDFDFRYYLHGHIHKSWRFSPIEGSNLLCINSGGCCRYAEGVWAGFYKITISPEKATVEQLHC